MKVDTRPLQNAKVMAREKQGEAAEKVMFMGKNPSKNRLFKEFGYCCGITFTFLYSKERSCENTT